MLPAISPENAAIPVASGLANVFLTHLHLRFLRKLVRWVRWNQAKATGKTVIVKVVRCSDNPINRYSVPKNALKQPFDESVRT